MQGWGVGEARVERGAGDVPQRPPKLAPSFCRGRDRGPEK